MDQIKATSSRRHRARLAPCLEPLEGRRLMAASATQVTISEGVSQGIPTLLVLGTNNTDVINISDNGTGNPGNVSVTLGNGSVYTSQTAISEIEVASRNGSDQVSYTLTGPLVTERTVLVYLGRGTQQFQANVNGAVDNPQGLDIEAYGGVGNDTMTINQSGQIKQGTFIPFLDGGKGNDTLTYNGTGSINGNATINPALAGGVGNNTIISNYSGTIDGNYSYNMTIMGGRRNDNIIDNINVGPGSVGTVGTNATTPAVIKAGTGKSNIHYAITMDPTANSAQVFAAVIDGSRRTTLQRTSNVMNDTKNAKDSVIAS